MTILLVGGLYLVLRFAFGLFTPLNYLTARHDIKNRKIQIVVLGEIFTTDKQKLDLAKTYGFELYFFGDNLSTEIINGTKYYNQTMVDYLERKYGSGWWTKFQAQLDSIDNTNSTTISNPKTPKAIYKLDSLDYTVISEGIYQFLTLPSSVSHHIQNYTQKSEYQRIGHYKSFVLIDSTFFDDPIGEYIIKEHNKTDSSDSIWTKSLNSNINFQSKIDVVCLKHLKYNSLTLTKMKGIFVSGDEAKSTGWDDFYKVYGNPSLIIKTSIPSFNESKDRSMIYVDAGAGPLQGRGGIIWLKKINGKWIAYDLVYLWEA